MAFLMGRCYAEYCCVPLGRWDYQGTFKPLHIMNQIRISFIRSAICRHFRFENNCLMYECTVHLHNYQLFFSEELCSSASSSSRCGDNQIICVRGFGAFGFLMILLGKYSSAERMQILHGHWRACRLLMWVVGVDFCVK